MSEAVILTPAETVASVRRRDGFYRLPPGVAKHEQYDSVTGALDVLAKPALYYWYGKQAAANVLGNPFRFDTAEKAVAGVRSQRDQAADRGSTIHSLAESLARGGSIDIDTVPEHLRGYAQAFLGFWEGVKPEPIITEANIYNDTWAYAGTTDLVAWIGGLAHLVDYKTSGDLYREVALQLVAYKHGEFVLSKDAPPNIAPMPNVEKTAAVLLKADGTWRFEVMTAPFDVFLACLKMSRWMRGGKK